MCQKRIEICINESGSELDKAVFSSRRELTKYEHELVAVYFARIDDRVLAPKFKRMFDSIKSYYEWDGRLSDKQLNALSKTKKACDAIQWKRSFRNVDDHLNKFFNPVSPR